MAMQTPARVIDVHFDDLSCVASNARRATGFKFPSSENQIRHQEVYWRVQNIGCQQIEGLIGRLASKCAIGDDDEAGLRKNQRHADQYHHHHCK
jgi:hypothetical protein